MSFAARSTRRRLGLALLSGLLLVSLGAGSALAQSASTGTPDPSTPVTGSPAVPSISDGAIPVVPNPDVVDAQPVPFDHVVVSADGRTLTVYYWHGAEECNGLREVTVAQTDGGIAITVWAGMLPEAVSRACIAIAQLYSTTVVLDEPLITFGGLD